MKKKLFLLSLSLLALVGCNKGGSTPIPTPKSEIRGTFYNTYSINMKFKTSFVDDGTSLFGSVYPAFLIPDNTPIKYNVDQKLSLRRDFSYVYAYSITLQNSFNNDIGKVDINMSGAYTYTVINPDLNTYQVELQNPQDGYEKIFGADINNISDLTTWTIHATPDYQVNFYDLASDSTFNYSNYSKGRKVNITKAITEEDPNVVEDSLYYRFILDDITRYSIIRPSR